MTCSMQSAKILEKGLEKKMELISRGFYSSDVKVIITSNCVIGIENVFEMRESRLGPASAAAIAKILKNTPQYTKLDLYGNSKKWNLSNICRHSRCRSNLVGGTT